MLRFFDYFYTENMYALNKITVLENLNQDKLFSMTISDDNVKQTLLMEPLTN